MIKPTKELKAAPTLTKVPFIRTAPTIPDAHHARIKREDIRAVGGGAYSVVSARRRGR